MNEQKFIRLIKKYQKGSLSDKEKFIIDDWLNSLSSESRHELWTGDEKSELKNSILEKLRLKDRDNIIHEALTEQSAIESRLNASKPVLQVNKKWILGRRVAAAATILLILGTSALYLLTRDLKTTKISNLPERYENDVLPGGNKATLTLSDGKTITLDDAKLGILAEQGDIRIVKKEEGQLVYDASDARGKEILYNTLCTPKGGQYNLILPDGSKVWLNSASSIIYPAQFSDKERKVQISGEAYFEVTPVTVSTNAGKTEPVPFIVDVNGFEVQVLGTRFNIMAYGDENNFKTTLLEGAVRIIKGNESELLKPGQQAIISKGAEDIQTINDADIEDAIAWKNGYFHFNHADIGTVMRQLSRWYDVEVIFEGDKPNLSFGGELQRDLSLSQVLIILEKSQVLFRIDGRKVIVMNTSN